MAEYDITNIDSLQHLAGTATQNEAIQLSATYYVIAYKDASGDGWLKTFSIDGDFDNITEIDSLEYDTANGIIPSIVKIDSTHFALSYTSTSSIGYVETYSVTAGGDTITLISSLQIDATQATSTSVELVDSTHLIVAYTGSGSDGFIKTFSFDGSFDNLTEIDVLEHVPANTISFNRIKKIDATHYVMTYRDSSADAWAKVITLDGSYNITDTSSLEYETGNAFPNDILVLSPTKFAIVYTFASDGWVETFSLNGSYVITSVDTFEFVTNGGSRSALGKIDSTHFVVVARGGSADGFIYVLSTDAGAANIAQESVLEFDITFGDEMGLTMIDSSHCFLAYYGSAANSGNIKTFSIELPTAIDVSDSVTITEDINIEAPPPPMEISVSDTVSIAENIATTQIHNISVNDTVSITENIEITEVSDISVNDTQTIAETITADNEQLGGINTNDTISISELVTIGFNYSISVSDILSIAEVITITNTQLGGISVSEDVAITENIAIVRVSEISVNDTIAISENVAQTSINLVNVNDSITVSEDIARTVSPIQTIKSARVYVASDTSTATAIEDMAGVSTTLELVRDGWIIVYMSLQSSVDAGGGKQGNFAISIDGVDSPVIIRQHKNANDTGSVGVTFGAELSAGTYTIKGRHFTEAGTTLTSEKITLIAVSGVDDGGNKNHVGHRDIASDDTTSASFETIDGLTGLEESSAGTHVFGVLAGSITSDTNNTDYSLRLVVDTETATAIRKVGTGGDVGAITIANRTGVTVAGSVTVEGEHSISGGATGTIAPALLSHYCLGFEDYGQTWEVPNAHSQVSVVKSTTSAVLEDIDETSISVTLLR